MTKRGGGRALAGRAGTGRTFVVGISLLNVSSLGHPLNRGIVFYLLLKRLLS